MLQQTTVASVRAGNRFEKFLAEFPNLQSIRDAPEEQLLKAWEGLGYYNRVRNLQKTARAVLADWGGEFPRSAAELETLPGVGPYTAGAIASFAFNEAAPIVDGNIARVLTRLFDSAVEIDTTAGRKQLWEWAGLLLDKEHPRLYNSALMEVGQVFCRPRQPFCASCPLAEFCQTREPEGLPRKKGKAKTVVVTEYALFARRAGKILLARESGSRRRGFYRLPLREEEEVADLELVHTSKYAITKHRVTLQVYAAVGAIADRRQEEEEWVPVGELARLPLVAPVKKVLTDLVD
ncbi:A/G-specific adenine glycosylase [Roseibacillus ishigakijimensis]|uniref:Adenine DNA glycosylase n=1 Tax=Roseibacillus ishigakijimensis TaxID=454146 RepID=A0A934RSY8_9BACT|nr:A/G-specific adenine glycosylase [Roseibacillus ishigakijimensis]MBK1834868.1 A/G-specific adenine glycosylase [Roseibacillus ishigakijimensis]